MIITTIYYYLIFSWLKVVKQYRRLDCIWWSLVLHVEFLRCCKNRDDIKIIWRNPTKIEYTDVSSTITGAKAAEKQKRNTDTALINDSSSLSHDLALWDTHRLIYYSVFFPICSVFVSLCLSLYAYTIITIMFCCLLRLVLFTFYRWRTYQSKWSH